jgi:hypothetical protein
MSTITKLKDTLNKYPLWGGGLSVIAILTIIYWQFGVQIRQSFGPPESPPSTWFYELDSGVLFTAPDIRPDLTLSPSGKHAVRAMVFSCGDCARADQRFTGWLETEEFAKGKTPPVQGDANRHWRAAREEDDQGDDADIRLWIRPPESKKWAPRDQSTINLLRQNAEQHCKDAKGTLTGCAAQ